MRALWESVRVVAVLVGLGSFGLVAAGACSTSDGTDPAGTGGTAAAGWGASACGTCVATACSTQIDACNGDPDCAAYLACLRACPLDAKGDADASCADACPTGSSTEATKAIAAVDACRSVGPGAACVACGVPPATDYTAPILNQTCTEPSTETNPCWICEDENCCDTYAACLADADCQAIKACLTACPDQAACYKACTEQHPTGSNLWGASVGCMFVLCDADQDACDGTQRDACLECFYGTCGDAYAYMLSAPGGYALERCLAVCPVDDTACDAVCYDAYPEAFPPFADLAACVDIACADSC